MNSGYTWRGAEGESRKSKTTLPSILQHGSQVKDYITQHSSARITSQRLHYPAFFSTDHKSKTTLPSILQHGSQVKDYITQHSSARITSQRLHYTAFFSTDHKSKTTLHS